MTMTSTCTTAGTMMAATAIARHIKHEDDKHSRGTPKAGLYFYFACLYGQRRPTLLHRNTSRSQRELASKQTQAEYQPIDFLSLVRQSHLPQPVFRSSAPLRLSLALALRSFVIPSHLALAHLRAVLLRFQPRLPLPLASLASLVASCFLKVLIAHDLRFPQY
ncbi:hypothetical protein L207DRAFT_179933 [Hyaloscypha variabilis F]|uniref:Uncharacterized protein n=1 Tax=Hyaloscypha variabilis (strain UAMH 11265 / GT02V1 / F) TaxID=1149755 RepID=A0A2J6R183_HYAVF|nr:hypothetical protein L207DRAFT_179933 [Hyaloscypha variabilis F]